MMFNEWSSTFSQDGWFTDDLVKIDVSTITGGTRMENFYLLNDDICGVATNKPIFDMVPDQVRYTEFLDRSGLTHRNILGAVDNQEFMSSLFAALESGIGCPIDD